MQCINRSSRRQVSGRRPGEDDEGGRKHRKAEVMRQRVHNRFKRKQYGKMTQFVRDYFLMYENQSPIVAMFIVEGPCQLVLVCCDRFAQNDTCRWDQLPTR